MEQLEVVFAVLENTVLFQIYRVVVRQKYIALYLQYQVVVIDSLSNLQFFISLPLTGGRTWEEHHPGDAICSPLAEEIDFKRSLELTMT